MNSRCRCMPVRFDDSMDSGEPNGWSTDAGDPLGSSALLSHRCRWEDLAEMDGHVKDGRMGLTLTADWASRWMAARRYGGGEVTVAVRDLASMPTAGAEHAQPRGGDARQRPWRPCPLARWCCGSRHAPIGSGRTRRGWVVGHIDDPARPRRRRSQEAIDGVGVSSTAWCGRRDWVCR